MNQNKDEYHRDLISPMRELGLSLIETYPDLKLETKISVTCRYLTEGVIETKVQAIDEIGENIYLELSETPRVNSRAIDLLRATEAGCTGYVFSILADGTNLEIDFLFGSTPEKIDFLE
jgi:hypothetical protein